MGTKRDVQRLLKKNLSGLEAARLVLRDCVEDDHGRKNLLTDHDIALIKNGLRTQPDIDVYNRMIQAYRFLSYQLKDLHILSLDIVIKLRDLLGILQMYWLDWSIHLTQEILPVFMTEQQLRETGDYQRKRKLQTVFPLKCVLQDRAYELASEDQQQECDLEPKILADRHPELLHQAKEQVLELIQSGKLTLVRISQQDVERMERLDEEVRSMTQRNVGNEKEWESLSEERNKLTHQAYEAVKRGNENVGETLAKCLEKSALESEEENRLLEYAYHCSGEDLYQSGMPEWISYIDEFTPGLFESYTENIVLIEEPPSHFMYKLHENGYYTIDLFRLSQARVLEESYSRDGADLHGDLRRGARVVREMIKIFMSYRSALEEASEIMGVNLAEDVDQWLQEIETKVDDYNKKICFEIDMDVDEQKTKIYRDQAPRMKAIHVSRLKPIPSFVMQFRENLAVYLGSNWWHESHEILTDQDEERI